MFTRTRVLTLAAAGVLVALTAAANTARAEDSAQGPHQPLLTTARQADLNLGECHLQRRAISRRACQARLWREMQIDTAENK